MHWLSFTYMYIDCFFLCMCFVSLACLLVFFSGGGGGGVVAISVAVLLSTFYILAVQKDASSLECCYHRVHAIRLILYPAPQFIFQIFSLFSDKELLFMLPCGEHCYKFSGYLFQ